MKRVIQQTGLAFAVAAVLWLPGRLAGAEVQTNSVPDQTNITQLCQQFEALQQRLQAESAAQDEELKQLVAQMNSAPAEQKPDAVAAVITKLVEQRLASHQRKQAMKGSMLQHLIQGMLDAEGNSTNATQQGISPPAGQPVPPPTVPQPSR